MKKAPGDNIHAYLLHLLYRLRITKECRTMSEECVIFEHKLWRFRCKLDALNFRWWKLKRRLRRQLRKPFKGQYAYEWQIGPMVLMWFHWDHLDYLPQPELSGFHIGPFQIWHDKHWFH